uniref:Uncharacterized protein n=1 Tax=Amphora coffeiformis TaxID=265554 RepID=A0A7S3L7T4_9STRA|eukprot:scaffold17456_cov191-Amphora_coffeaeformis.AAC.1
MSFTNEARQAETGVSPPRTEVSAVASPFRRRRFGGETRREALERRLVHQRVHNHHGDRSSSDTTTRTDVVCIDKDEKKKDEKMEERNNLHATSLSSEEENPKEVPIEISNEGASTEIWKTPPRKTNLQQHLDIVKDSRLLEDNTATTTDVTESTMTKPERVLGGYTALSESLSPANTNVSAARSLETGAEASSPRRGPLHENMVFYRVVYRGVVALLSGPDSKAARSGHYLGYGEIFGSTQEIALEDDHSVGPSLTARTEDHGSFSAIDSFLDSPPRSIFSQAGSVSSIETFQTKSTTIPLTPEKKMKSIPQPFKEQNNNAAIRVEEILTGGYAKDAMDAQTPKKSNVDEMSQITCHGPDGTLGYLFAKQKNRDIIQRISGPPPIVEEGVYRYKVVSSTPLPILTGPAWDAPRTKAMVLPGTMQEVSLRVSFREDSKIMENQDSSEEVWFLRMSHRRGWIASHRRGRCQPVVKELVGADASDMCSIVSARSVMTDDAQSVLSSVAVSSVATPSAVARRRHRPPRRRREVDVSRTQHQLDHSRHATPLKNPAKISQEQHMYTPSSNVSLLSDDSSLDRRNQSSSHPPDSPDVSYATQRSNSSTATAATNHFLFRVTAPKGLDVLDAPHYQVNNLIRGKPPTNPVAEPQGKSILKTMPGRTATSSQGQGTVFEASSKKRVIPRGAVFEASKRMESSAGFSQGAGLIKLADNSGWAIVPHREDLERQYQHFQGDITLVKEGDATKAVEEVGNTFHDGSSDRSSTVWYRIHSRSGLTVQCAPHISLTRGDEDDNTSPSSSRGGSSIVSGSINGSNANGFASESDVASSVASTFVDAMLFRTPKKRDGEQRIPTSRQQDQLRKRLTEPKIGLNIPCGNCIEVERWVDLSMDQRAVEFARLAGGQGWVPLYKAEKATMTPIVPPEFRFGSFWFRVQAGRGIKVRLGPSMRAPSIKSDDDVQFRFECGEFLRASEIMTVFSNDGQPLESYAKLYRNRHVRLHNGHEEHRQLQSLTTQSEWVQIYNEKELFLEECAGSGPPRIERHKQGWRYNVIPEEGLPVRKGPSFAAETTGTRLFGGETVLINERVIPAGDKITWLRMKDGEGWLHDVDDTGRQVVIAHSLRHRARTVARSNRATDPNEEVAYNTIIARLFHNEGGEASRRVHGGSSGVEPIPLRRSNQL